MTGKPTIRILHGLARTGGTIVSRCIGCMSGVALLSEIHPTLCHEWNNPRTQAREWYGVDVQVGLPFVDTVAALEEAFRARGLALVLRSWDFVDYVPSRHNVAPAMLSTLVETLRERFELREAWLTRTPANMLASLRLFMPDDDVLTDAGFAAGYAAYNAKSGVPRVSHEMFCEHPRFAIDAICAGLGLTVDPGWPDKWQRYVNVTGDIENQLARTVIG